MGWLAILLSIIFVLLCIALVLIILIQPGQSEGLAGAFGSGGMLGSAFGVHAKNRLMKMTTVMIILFFLIIFTFAKIFPNKQEGLGEGMEQEAQAAAQEEAEKKVEEAKKEMKEETEKKAEEAKKVPVPEKKEEPEKPEAPEKKPEEDAKTETPEN